jgi:hypothetical protein
MIPNRQIECALENIFDHLRDVIEVSGLIREEVETEKRAAGGISAYVSSRKRKELGSE